MGVIVLSDPLCLEKKLKATMPHVSKDTSRILIVDDDEGVRDLIGSLLSEAGLAVATAPTALAALDILAENDFDLMVTDVALPDGLNGLELVKCARARHPSLKSLFISGCCIDPVGDDPEQDNFVAKPFRPRELLGCVWELLGRQLPEKQVSSPQRVAERAILEAKFACLRRQ